MLYVVMLITERLIYLVDWSSCGETVIDFRIEQW